VLLEAHEREAAQIARLQEGDALVEEPDLLQKAHQQSVLAQEEPLPVPVQGP